MLRFARCSGRSFHVFCADRGSTSTVPRRERCNGQRLECAVMSMQTF